MFSPIDSLRADWMKRDQELAEHINRILKQQNLTGQISVIEQQKEILSHLYQNANSFSNVIILAGYAGIFGVWQITRGSLSKETMMWVALLTSCSIVLFVSFEVWKMISQALFLQRLNKILLSSIAEQDRVNAWKIACTDYGQKEGRIWIYFLVPTVLSGFSAGFILIHYFIVNLR